MACWCNGKCPHIGKPQEALNQKNHHRARQLLRNSLTVAPLCVEANFMVANLLCQHNHAHAAMAHVDRAAQNADPARVHFERGKVHRAGVHLAEAREEFFKALQLDPDNPHVACGLVGALEMAGLLKEAKEVCDQARKKFPDYTDLRRLAAVIADGLDGAGAALAELVKGPPLSPIEFLDQGRYFEKEGAHAAAWQSWDTGKTMLREKFGHIYNPVYFAKHFAALKESASGPRPKFVRAAPDLATYPAPLFICGFPRSGTTMTESIFGGHSGVIAGDELMGVTDVIEALPAWLKVRMPYPAAMLATSLGENAAIPEMLRDLYMRGAQERLGFSRRPATIGAALTKPSKKRPLYFTDKMPLNELHLPLLRMLFPAAPIFRLQRHPLDVMVSCMSNWLVFGGYYASSLEVAARHYRAVDDVVQHYEKTFAAADRRGFVTVRYENLVSDQEAATAELLAAAGLALEPGCLAFHKTKRTARTLSYRQVQQPLNSRGVGRWKNFREQLAPAVEILRPILEREGYAY